MKNIWITWERQRRSIELAEAFNAELFIIDGNGFTRYFVCLWKTLRIICANKPDNLFVQNPSMILAFFTSFIFKPFFSYYLIVDRHSNFLLTKKKRFIGKELLFNFLSYITIRYADLTIVTNNDLAHVIRVLGGTPFVLPDKIPTIAPAQNRTFSGEKKILVISSFAEDEPIEEIWQAFREDEMSTFSVYMSGNSKKIRDSLTEIPKNITLTGFLSEDDFIDLLFQVDAVMVLSKMEYTLLCGCYEAVSAEKPVITSDTAVLRQLFTGAVFVKSDPISIADGVKKIFCDLSKFKLKSSSMKKELTEKWDMRFNDLVCLISNHGQIKGKKR